MNQFSRNLMLWAAIVLAVVEHLLELNIITVREYELIKIAVNDRTLGLVEDKNKVRADILKGMVNILLS